MRNRVFILGAGFSRAISDGIMPDTNALGKSALEKIATDLNATSQRVFASGTFEEQLSRLAEAQPDLSVAENLQRRSYFVRLSNAVADAIEQAQFEAVGSEDFRTDELLRLVGILHATRSTLVTFNYDLLVEYAVMNHQLNSFPSSARVDAGSVLRDLPTLEHGSFSGNPSNLDTFRLVKLHGSLDWWWVDGDETGATMVRRRYEDIQTVDPAQRLAGQSTRFPGRSRFVVPPTAVKSSFYTNPITTELWRQAAAAIRDAELLYFVGYSLPPTDFVVRGMIREHVQAGATVFVVNPDARVIIRELKRWLPPGVSVRSIGGEMCVFKMIDQLQRDVSSDVVAELSKYSLEEYGEFRVVVADGLWGAKVTEVRLTRGILRLNCGEIESRAMVHTNAGIQPITYAELRSQISNSLLKGIVASFLDGKNAVVVGIREMYNDVGYDQCLNLLVADKFQGPST